MMDCIFVVAVSIPAPYTPPYLTLMEYGTSPSIRVCSDPPGRVYLKVTVYSFPIHFA